MRMRIPLTIYVIILVVGFLIGTFSARASPASDDFSKSIALEVIDYGYARAANECHLRSNWWWETLNRGFQDFFYAESFKFKLTDADREAAQQNVNELASFTTKRAQGPRYDCADLVNSPIMKRLDKVQDQMVGGYK